MNITEETPRVEIVIQGATFSVPTPYAEGHTLTANEANALNQVLTENLRNNFANKVKAALETVDGAVDNLNMDELQAALDAYSKDYEFGVRKIGARSGTTALEKEAMSIARRIIKKKLAATKTTLDEETMDRYVLEASKTEKILEMAKKSLEIKKETSEIEL